MNAALNILPDAFYSPKAALILFIVTVIAVIVCLMIVLKPYLAAKKKLNELDRKEEEMKNAGKK